MHSKPLEAEKYDFVFTGQCGDVSLPPIGWILFEDKYSTYSGEGWITAAILGLLRVHGVQAEPAHHVAGERQESGLCVSSKSS